MAGQKVAWTAERKDSRMVGMLAALMDSMGQMLVAH
jgi:hypothetical protein